MIKAREALIEELPYFVEMERAGDTAEFVTPDTLEKHRIEFSKANIIYLSIINTEALVGFIILALEPDGVSVEFKRIVVSVRNRGFGQSAMVAMEDFCTTKLNRKRVWLDVFEFNARGRHIYEKFGYVQFDYREHHGKPLLFYEKTL